MKTSELVSGQTIRLKQFLNNTSYSQQLQSVGLTPGTLVTVKRRAPLGDPIELEFRGLNLAIRQGESQDLVWELV